MTFSVINVIISNFSGRSSSFIQEIIIMGKGKEIVKCFFFEEVGISWKFVEWLHTFDFSETNWHTSGFPVLEISFEHINSIDSFIMFSYSFNKYKRCVTSFILKFSNHSINFTESVIDPRHVVSGINLFLLDKDSVGNSSIINTSVCVHDWSKFSNSVSECGFSFIVRCIKWGSFIKSRLFETIQNIHYSVYCITSSFFQLHELLEFRWKEFSIS